MKPLFEPRPSAGLRLARRLISATALLSILFATQGAAEQPGLSHGRLATPAAMSVSSAEFGLRRSDEFSYLGLRYNTRSGDRSSYFFDLGSTRFDRQSSAETVGAGAYYYWGPVASWLDLSANVAIHHIAGATDTTFLGVGALFSSPDTRTLYRRWQWYANIGLSRPLNRSESPDLGVSLGVVTPTANGQLYAGFDTQDEALALGYRFRLR